MTYNHCLPLQCRFTVSSRLINGQYVYSGLHNYHQYIYIVCVYIYIYIYIYISLVVIVKARINILPINYTYICTYIRVLSPGCCVAHKCFLYALCLPPRVAMELLQLQNNRLKFIHWQKWHRLDVPVWSVRCDQKGGSWLPPQNVYRSNTPAPTETVQYASQVAIHVEHITLWGHILNDLQSSLRIITNNDMSCRFSTPIQTKHQAPQPMHKVYQSSWSTVARAWHCPPISM